MILSEFLWLNISREVENFASRTIQSEKKRQFWESHLILCCLKSDFLVVECLVSIQPILYQIVDRSTLHNHPSLQTFDLILNRTTSFCQPFFKLRYTDRTRMLHYYSKSCLHAFEIYDKYFGIWNNKIPFYCKNDSKSDFLEMSADAARSLITYPVPKNRRMGYTVSKFLCIIWTN